MLGGDSGFVPALAFKFQRNKMFFPRLLVNIQYCGDQIMTYKDGPRTEMVKNIVKSLF